MIPLIFGSDETPFTSLGGDKKGWPLFMSLANIHSSIRNAHSLRAWIHLASLPTIPKKPTSKGKNANFTLAGWGLDKNDTIQETLETILKDLTRLYSEGIEIECSDGKVRVCHPILAGWIADYKEYGSLFQVKNNSCVNCEIPMSSMGDNVKGPARNFSAYKRKYHDYMDMKEALEAGGLGPITHKRYKQDTTDIGAWFFARRAHLADRLFHEDNPALSSKNLWKPDLLHTLYEGMAKHLFNWILGLLKKYDRLHRFNERWLAIPRYNDMTSPSKSFFQMTQKTGKEMRTATRLLLPVLTAALDSPKPTEAAVFDKAINCTRYMVDFMLLCHYNEHTDESIQLLTVYLEKFHSFKDVFLEFRAGAAAKDAVDEAQRGGANLSTSEQHNILRDNANFSLPKLHLLSYFAETIQRFGNLHHWSTEVVEGQLSPLKAAYRDSNKVNATAQVIAAVSREYTLDVLELNIKEATRTAIEERARASAVDEISKTADGRAPRTGVDENSTNRQDSNTDARASGAAVDEIPYRHTPKRPAWIDDVQTSLMMYADSKSSRAAAQANRQYEYGTDSPHGPVKDEYSETASSTTDDDKSTPPALFSGPIPLSRHMLSGTLKPARKVKSWSIPRNVAALASTFKMPFLPKLLMAKLGFGRVLPVDKVGYLPVEALSCLQITSEVFQSHYLEVLKARTSLPAHLQQRVLQEAVYYDDSPNEHGGFENFAIGKVLSYFTVWVPDSSNFPLLHVLNKSSYTNPTIHRLAVVQTYRYDNGGEFFRGCELGRVTLERDSEKMYKIIDIEQILRPAHLIPLHDPTTRYEPTMRWYVNNRIDDATWDMFYGRVD